MNNPQVQLVEQIHRNFEKDFQLKGYTHKHYNYNITNISKTYSSLNALIVYDLIL